MTKQLMTLAGGKVVLVLEGGYILPALCDTAETCLRALLHMEVRLPALLSITMPHLCFKYYKLVEKCHTPFT